MVIAGIIAEFNPFHNGHRYLIDSVRQKTNADAIIVVMSGNFTQRGEPALWNKWIRAECAVRNGVDLVLELPACFAVNSGASFATGGIAILKGTGMVTHLAFGSESGNLNDLVDTAKKLSKESGAFSKCLHDALDTGVSYPVAYEIAASMHPDLETKTVKRLFGGSNDILGLEYIKQSIAQNASFVFCPIKRVGVKHDGKVYDTYASASYIRNMIQTDAATEAYKHYVPAETSAVLREVKSLPIQAYDRYATLLRYAILSKSNTDLEAIISVSEGLENRIRQASITAISLEDLIGKIKTKRYTRTRISRTLVQLILGMEKEQFQRVLQEHAFYGRVLALNQTGAQVLRLMKKGKSSIEIYANDCQAREATGALRQSLAWDHLATDLYSILSNTSVYEGSDAVQRPFICF